MLGWLLIGRAMAHDLWMGPATFAPTPGVPVPFTLVLGSGGVVEERQPHDPARVVRFEVVQGSRAFPLPASGPLSIPADGPALVRLDRTTAHADLVPETFAHYLSEEGFTEAAAERERRGEATTNGREDYDRFLKLLLGSGAMFDVPVGQTWELVLLDDPALAAAGSPLRVRALFEGAPAAGARVDAYGWDPRGAVAHQRGVTNERGEVTLPAPAGGPVVLRSVRFRRCSDCATAEWRSWWSSYAFSVGPVKPGP
jgi:hypothetical protein